MINEVPAEQAGLLQDLEEARTPDEIYAIGLSANALGHDSLAFLACKKLCELKQVEKARSLAATPLGTVAIAPIEFVDRQLVVPDGHVRVF